MHSSNGGHKGAHNTREALAKRESSSSGSGHAGTWCNVCSVCGYGGAFHTQEGLGEWAPCRNGPTFHHAATRFGECCACCLFQVVAGGRLT